MYSLQFFMRAEDGSLFPSRITMRRPIKDGHQVILVKGRRDISINATMAHMIGVMEEVRAEVHGIVAVQLFCGDKPLGMPLHCGGPVGKPTVIPVPDATLTMIDEQGNETPLNTPMGNYEVPYTFKNVREASGRLSDHINTDDSLRCLVWPADALGAGMTVTDFDSLSDKTKERIADGVEKFLAPGATSREQAMAIGRRVCLPKGMYAPYGTLTSVLAKIGVEGTEEFERRFKDHLSAGQIRAIDEYSDMGPDKLAELEDLINQMSLDMHPRYLGYQNQMQKAAMLSSAIAKQAVTPPKKVCTSCDGTGLLYNGYMKASPCEYCQPKPDQES